MHNCELIIVNCELIIMNSFFHFYAKIFGNMHNMSYICIL